MRWPQSCPANDLEPSPCSVEKPAVKPYVPPISFPLGLRKNKTDKQFCQFLITFKKFHINNLFTNALEQMPKYTKFLKKILSNKRKLEEHKTVMLNEEYSAILQNKQPLKLKDPGNFIITFTIGIFFQ